MSHIAFTYHFVFSTHLRVKSIDQDHEKELYKMMYNYLSKREVYVRRIGGMPDHVHLLCDIPPKYAVADVIQHLKIESSKFMRVNSHFPLWNGWTEGSGGSTVDACMREVRKRYIMNQRAHHKNMTFEEEYKQMLRELGLEDFV